MIEITVFDGYIQLVVPGLTRNFPAQTTGRCKLVVPVMHWFGFIEYSQEKQLKIVVTEGEIMVGRATINVKSTYFETDRILRSIPLPVNPKAIDYWKLEYQAYMEEELQFNAVESKIEDAKREFEQIIRRAAKELAEFRISREELKEMILARIRDREKVDFRC